MSKSAMLSLAAAYEGIRDRQASNRNKEITDFNRRVSQSIFNATMLALQDHQSGNARYRVVSAPTGSGKTSYAISMIATMVERQEASAVIVSHTIDQCEDIYKECLKVMNPEDIAIWTSAHDYRHDKSATLERHGFVPQRQFSLDALSRYPVAIVTHQFFKGPRAELALNYNGSPRVLKIIDEQPTDVSIHDITTGNVKTVRDIAAERFGAHSEGVATLTRLHDYMEEIWQDAESKACFDAMEYEDLSWFASNTAKALAADSSNETMKQVLGFGRSVLSGFAFLSRYDNYGKGCRFVGYEMDMPVHPGTVLLDATADIDGVSLIASNRSMVESPTLDYSRLTIKHVSIPATVVKPRERVSQIVKTATRARPYAEWINDTIVRQSKEGDLVLAVVHKALLNHQYLPEGCKSWDNACNIEGREVCFINWGYGIGSNRWKEANMVCLFGEFHVPKRATVATVLGLKGMKASEGYLKQVQSPGSKDAELMSVQEGHLFRWEKQLAMRGNARNIDAHGVCGEQRLVITGEFARFVRYKDRLFPGAKLDASSEALRKVKRGKSALIVLLGTTEESQISISEVKELSGADMLKHKARYLDCPDVQHVMARRGWAYQRGNGRGNKSGFLRAS